MDEFILRSVFHHIPGDETKDEIYWRSCVLKDGMSQGEQGYMIYWPKTNDHLHTYRNPEDWY